MKIARVKDMLIKLGEKKEKVEKSYKDNILNGGDLNRILEWKKEENYDVDINRVDSKYGDNGICGK